MFKSREAGGGSVCTGSASVPASVPLFFIAAEHHRVFIMAWAWLGLRLHPILLKAELPWRLGGCWPTSGGCNVDELT